jgi:ERCC4-type nuclease
MVVIQDTREQRPLFTRPPKGLTVQTATLKNGDYSIKGFEDLFAVERKQMSDFYAYIGKEREVTDQKVVRFGQMIQAGGWAALVIEADERDVLGGFQMSKVPPEVARQFLVSLEIRHGIHVYCNRDRKACSRWILDRMIKFWRVRREV